MMQITGSYKERFRYFGIVIRTSLLFFHQQRASMLAASASFYALLALIPLLLLNLRVIGLILGDIEEVKQRFFTAFSDFFPEISSEILLKVEHIISSLLFSAHRFTWLNLLILVLSALGFLNSLWNGIYLLTHERSTISWTRHLKGLVIIGVTTLLVSSMMVVLPLFSHLLAMLHNSMLLLFFERTIPGLESVVNALAPIFWYLDWLLNSNLIHGGALLIYFTLLYRWFYSWRISFRHSLFGAVAFVFTLVAGKNMLWIYLTWVGKDIVQNYGDFYLLFVGMLWIFLSSCSFFLGASVAHTADRVQKMSRESDQKLTPHSGETP
jgi:membrane protein